jgi:uncharacterized protein (TIGR02452 family)
MSNRNKRAEIAQQTLAILTQGFYENHLGQKIEIATALDNAQTNSVLYAPDDFDAILSEINSNTAGFQTQFEVNNQTTLEGVRGLLKQGDEKIACLNFASAKNPGGGFLGGSQAQEESLARASGLYPCIAQMSEMYDTNRKGTSCLYLDYMIYSPDIPVFRDDDDRLLDEPYSVSIITAPAVNAGAIRQNEPKNIDKIGSVMMARIEKVLALAMLHQHTHLVLGAWGCGVFQNNPEDVARYFALHLKEGKFKNVFEKVVFAVLDSSKTQNTWQVFADLFGS